MQMNSSIILLGSNMKTICVFFCALLITLVRAEELGVKGYRDPETIADEKLDEASLPLDPSSKSAVFIHEEDMAFVVIPGQNDSQTLHERGRRNAVLNSGQVWPGGIVPYQIASVFNDNERRVILSAMKHWEDNTCIRFRPRRSGDINSVFIMSGGSWECWSYIGRLYWMRYRSQGLSLGPGCVTLSTVTHELGHAVGFYHEHTRPDRDDYITVRNNDPDLDSQLDKLSNSNTLGLGYDHASIMHYSSLGGVISSKSGVPFGNAEELSPLDIVKARRLYSCGDKDTWPAPSTVVPPLLSLPPNTVCGSVIKTSKSGFFNFPGSPTHPNNKDCTYVLQAPSGYGFDITFSSMPLGYSYRCTDEYVQMFFGASTAQNDIVYFGSRYPGGRICRVYDIPYHIDTDVLTIKYRTDNTNAYNMRVNYVVRDINECSFYNLCHQCTNRVGSYECTCRDGYYHSPAANTCYDVNECAFGNGGCKDICKNNGGSYSCACGSGFLQADGLSCGRTAPAVTPRPLTPGTIIPISNPTTPTATSTTTPTTTPTTPPTTAPTTPPTTPPLPSCGGTLSGSSGSYHTPNWPDSAYPLYTTCEWTMKCPGDNQLIDLTFDERFKVAGAMPSCPKDLLEVVDSGKNVTHGPFCHTTAPAPLLGLSNSVRVKFIAYDQRSMTRIGFSVRYVCMDRPTTMAPTTTPPPPTTMSPPTTMPPLSCGGTLNGPSGSFHTPNWPDSAYPLYTTCEWTMKCPGDNQLIDLTFDERFKVAGAMPSCPKDLLEVVDNGKNVTHGPFCHTTAPAPLLGLSNSVRVKFIAYDQRSMTRIGFSVGYVCMDRPTTMAPTTTATTTPPPSTTTSTTPPTTSSTTPPTTSSTTPSTASSTTPPATSSTTPPTTSSTTPPATSSTTSQTTPLTSSTMSPTNTSSTTPPTSTLSSCALLSTPQIPDGSRFICNGIIHSNKAFGPEGFQEDDNSLSGSTCSYFLSGSSATNVIHQVRFKYLDFPHEMSCADLSFTIYETLSSFSRAVKTICGSEMHCNEFVVGPLRRSSLARLTVSDNVAGSFRGFLAVFEEITTTA